MELANQVKGINSAISIHFFALTDRDLTTRLSLVTIHRKSVP
jgi:hypothetical protein